MSFSSSFTYRDSHRLLLGDIDCETQFLGIRPTVVGSNGLISSPSLMLGVSICAALHSCFSHVLPPSAGFIPSLSVIYDHSRTEQEEALHNLVEVSRTSLLEIELRLCTLRIDRYAHRSFNWNNCTLICLIRLASFRTCHPLLVRSITCPLFPADDFVYAFISTHTRHATRVRATT